VYRNQAGRVWLIKPIPAYHSMDARNGKHFLEDANICAVCGHKAVAGCESNRMESNTQSTLMHVAQMYSIAFPIFFSLWFMHAGTGAREIIRCNIRSFNGCPHSGPPCVPG
jgi:hypothetical protein